MATNDSRKSKAQLIQELNLLRGRTKQTSADPVEERARAIETRRVEEALGGVTVENAVQSITKANIDLSRVLSDAQEQAVAKVKELETIDKAIEMKKAELRELHDKDVILSSTAALLADYDAKKKELVQTQQDAEEGVRLKTLELERAYTAKKMDLEFGFRTQQAQMNQTLQEDMRRKADELEGQLRQKQLVARNEEEMRIRNWQQREEALQKQEAEVTELKAKVAGFPAELDAAVKKEVAIVSNAMKRDYEHKIALMDQTSKSNEAMLRQQIVMVEKNNEMLAKTLIAKEQELATSKQQVADIATKALDASSGALARDTLLQDRAAGRDGQGVKRS